MFEKNLDVDELVDELLEKYPVFGSTLNGVKIKLSKKVPTAATDGNTIYINKEFLSSKPKEEQLFILAHEVCHIVLNHIPRAKGRDPMAWNYATDAIINEHLVKDGLTAPDGVIRKDDALKYDAEELYDEVYAAHKKDQEQKQKQQQAAQNGQQGASGQQGQQGDGQQQGQNGQSQQANGQQGAENQQGGQGQSNGQQDNSTPQESQGGGQQQQGQSGQDGQQSQNGQNQQQNGGQGGGQQGGDNQQQTNQQVSGSGQQGDGGANWEDENGEKSDAESQQNQNQQENGGQQGGQGGSQQGGQNQQQNGGQKQQGNQGQQQNNGQGGGDGQKHDAASEHPYSADDYNNGEMDNDQTAEQQQGGGSGAGGGKQSDGDLIKNKQNAGGGGGNDGDLMPQDEKKQNDPYGGIFDSENEDMLGHDDHSMWSKVQEKKKDDKNNKEDPEEQQGFNSEKELFEKNDEIKREEAQKIMEHVRSRSRGLGGEDGEFALDGIGKKEKAVVDWRRLLKSYVKKEEERWGHRFSDSGNNWAARIEDYEIDDRAESEIIIDTSGSVSSDLVRAFLRQAKTILKDSDIKIGMFSSEFYGWQEIKKEEDIDELRFYGGGGTNFDAASRAFSKKKTVNHICLTDGEDGGDAGIREKRSDIIWICYGNPYFKPDNGKVIYVAPEELTKAPERKNKGRTY